MIGEIKNLSYRPWDIKQNSLKMKLIIINIARYREKDGIATGLGEDGLVTFRIPGLYSPKSPFVAFNNLMSIIEPTLTETKGAKHLILKEAQLLFSPMLSELDIHYVACMSILIEATNKLVQDDDKALLYQDLFNALLAMKNKINPYLVALKYLIKISSIAGFEFNVNRCIRCDGKKDIIAFSFQEGGFICKNCMTPEDINDLDVPEMKLFRNTYLHEGYDFTGFAFDEKVVVSLLKKINIFFEDAIGYKINTIISL